jgi:hypothetical protein
MDFNTLFPFQTCSKCRQAKGVSEFPVNSYERDTLRSHCQDCVNEAQVIRRRRPAQLLNVRKVHLRDRFGITLEHYDSLLASQNDVCAICNGPETAKRNGVIRRLSVDHNHSTGAVRGLLCQKCNSGIGYFRESAELLKAAITYLQTHTTK